MERINTEAFINLIEARPAIWDKTLDCYKDKNLKSDAWKEICTLVFDGFEELDQRDKDDYGKLIVKKWTHIRDSWMKSIKKQRDRSKLGSGRASRTYLYNDQLCFLQKILDTRSGHENADIESNEIDEDSDDIPISQYVQVSSSMPMYKKRKCDQPVDFDRTASLFDHQMNPQRYEHENHHLSFFKGLLPSLATLNDDQTLEFQAGVIGLLQKIKRKP